jgi:hypothetical protein
MDVTGFVMSGVFENRLIWLNLYVLYFFIYLIIYKMNIFLLKKKCFDFKILLVDLLLDLFNITKKTCFFFVGRERRDN